MWNFLSNKIPQSIYIIKIYIKDVILDKYLQELKDLIKDDGQNIIEDKYYEYKIEKWNNFSNNRLRKYVYPDSKTWYLFFILFEYNILFLIF